MKKNRLYIILCVAVFCLSCESRVAMQDNDALPESVVALDPEVANFNTTAKHPVISSQTTVKSSYGVDESPVRTFGFIAPDERRSNKVAARVAGRIERLYVKYENQFVRKGEKLLDLYSPQLNTAQEELLYVHKADAGGTIEREAEKKLRLLGLEQEQISEIVRSSQVSSTVTIYSPYDGYVFFSPSANVNVEDNSLKTDRTSMKGMAMAAGEGTGKTTVKQAGQIRQGDYISAGQTLFWINDLREVWGIISIDNRYISDIAPYDSVSVTTDLMPGKSIPGRIAFIEPRYAAGNKFSQARIYLSNNQQLFLVNSVFEASIFRTSNNVLTLPASTILYLGDRQAVWKKTGVTGGGNYLFEIQFVTAVPISSQRVAIKRGLSAGDEVALDAGYMIDRESLIMPY